jgi:ribose transport system permease protein
MSAPNKSPTKKAESQVPPGVETDIAPRETRRPGVMRARRPRVSSPHAMSLLITSTLFVAVLVAYVIGFVQNNHAWPAEFELTSTANSAFPLVLAAAGQAIVVLAGGLDLSVGGVIDLTNAVAAKYMTSGASTGTLLATTAAIVAVGAVIGAINGALIVYARQQPIIVTLGMLAILQGLALWVLPQPGGSIPPSVTNKLVPAEKPLAVVLIAVVCAAWWVVRRLRFGTGLYAVGSDPKAARASGISPARVSILAYASSGMLAAIAGLVLAASTTGGDPQNGDIFTLTSLAAVVVGGVSLAGGRGSVVGAVLGALILTVLGSLLLVYQLNPLYVSLWQGVFLLVAAGVAGAMHGLHRGFVSRRAAKEAAE